MCALVPSTNQYAELKKQNKANQETSQENCRRCRAGDPAWRKQLILVMESDSLGREDVGESGSLEVDNLLLLRPWAYLKMPAQAVSGETTCQSPETIKSQNA